MNQIINMIVRQVMRRLISKGVDVGFSQASKLGRRKPGQAGDPEGGDISPQEAANRDRQGRQQGKQARDAIKTMRRLNRF